MKLLKNKFFYLIVLSILFLGILFVSILGRNDTSTSPGATKDTPPNSVSIKVEDQKDTTKYLYKIIPVTQAMLSNGEVPECCRGYYTPDSRNQALVIEATEANGNKTLYWFNVTSTGRTSYEFFPRAGTNPKIVGSAPQKSLEAARRNWTVLNYKNGPEEHEVKVEGVSIAIQFIQDSFSTIPHSNY